MPLSLSHKSLQLFNISVMIIIIIIMGVCCMHVCILIIGYKMIFPPLFMKNSIVLCVLHE